MVVGEKKEVISHARTLEEARIAELFALRVAVYAKIAPINAHPTEQLIKLQQLNSETSFGETIYLEHCRK